MDLRERPATLTARHPWETVRARFFPRLLADPQRTALPVSVLDVGAGDGFVGRQLLDALPAGSSVTCYDPEYTDAHLAILHGSAPTGLSFASACPDREFDVIVLLDVLEHIADDRGFLRGLVDRRLRATGLVLVSVPAHQALFTQHDVALGHQRRYSARELRAVLGEVGLLPRTAGSLFGSLIVPRAIAKALERARGIRSQPASAGLADQISTGLSAWQHGPVVTGAVCRALELDARLCELAARFTVPNAGLSVWALCERRS
jgi:2-polyprenyl-3-methyl-5-hydroxy-6-metoxy-1,4-benzoquinol methylase